MPLAEVKKIIALAEPEIGSDFVKLLEKVRIACTNAAQVKEILKVDLSRPSSTRSRPRPFTTLQPGCRLASGGSMISAAPPRDHNLKSAASMALVRGSGWDRRRFQ